MRTIFALNLLFCCVASADLLHEQSRQRRPVALVSVGTKIYGANRDSGSVSVIDTVTLAVENEYAIGKRTSDLAATPDGRTLFLLDDVQHQIKIIDQKDGSLRLLSSMSVAKYPVDVIVSSDGKCVAVSSLWSRRSTLFSFDSENRVLKKTGVVDLPFSPRRQWLSPDARTLIVADAFGGMFGVVDVVAQKLVSLRSLDGHNIRGLAPTRDGKELMVTHQLLNEHVPTVRERIFWGSVLGNVVKEIELTEILKPVEKTSDYNPIAHWSLHPLGEPSNAAGDPGALAISKKGATVIALSGVNQVAIRSAPRQPISRRDVGRRPIDVVFGPDQSTAYVANQLDDSISVVDVADLKVTKTISLGPQPKLSLAQRGEQLFFDARLSLDGWYSCHSCHTDGHSNGRLNDNFGDDSFGAPKRIPTLLGVAQTGPWSWTGSQPDLSKQLHKSITVTMRGKEKHGSAENLKALIEFLKTLEPPPSLAVARGDVIPAAVERGRLVFARAGCADCHSGREFTSPDSYDVGIHDELGNKRFNPPSLRGVSQRGPYFHDGRAEQLEDVFHKFQHQGSDAIPVDDLRDLVSFLRSL